MAAPMSMRILVKCNSSMFFLSVVMVAYFCHQLSDNYVDLSDLYVVLSDLYVDLSDPYVDLSLK